MDIEFTGKTNTPATVDAGIIPPGTPLELFPTASLIAMDGVVRCETLTGLVPGADG